MCPVGTRDAGAMLAVTLVLPEANVANSSIQLDAEARAQTLVWSGVALGGRLKG